MVRWLFLAMTVTACDPGGPGADLADEGLSERAPLAPWYTVTGDNRDCAWPMCGGYFLTAVNARFTRCADGTRAPSCYVADLDTDGLFRDPSTEDAFLRAASEGRALVRGRYQAATVGQFDITELRVDHAWEGVTGSTPTGRFVKVTDTGMLCFAYPCANLEEVGLHGRGRTMIAELDFTPSGATPDEIAKATAALSTPDGLIVAGRRYEVSGAGGTAPARTVTELWLHLASR